MDNFRNDIELLAPVGNFECLKAAVQNGADSVYFGADTFSARASATNFSLSELKTAIEYAKIRNVKTNLTLNTLIKDDEFSDALDVATFAYENGIDAIIVQDLGLAKYLINNFPDLPIHASTQMTIHNLEGALEAEKLGFKRAVLSREVTLENIKKICASTSMEIEVFIHGALCISYSGQCLLSSMIGGRSGNRGRCAQPCRLPYKLVYEYSKNELKSDENYMKTFDEGYILSTRDLCGLEFIPELIKAGVKCFKIEGRMKPPEYVATVTRIYRKYIELAKSNNSYVINNNDKKELLQVFNRGGFSNGHFNTEPNLDLVSPEKPNNMGLFLGKVHDFNSNNGYITLKLSETLKIGDTISLEKETGTYTVSELMIDGINSPVGNTGNIVKIGRMKGNININDKIFKLSSKELTQSARKTFEDNEIKKIPLNCKIFVKENNPISIIITPSNNSGFYKDIKIEKCIKTIPTQAMNSPITKERITSQITKTGNTPYEFKNIDIELDDNLYITGISCLNELRRSCIEELQNQVIINNCNKKIKTKSKNSKATNKTSNCSKSELICVLLNTLNIEYNYFILENIDKVYIPFRFFTIPKYSNIIDKICNKFSTYIYLPVIFKNTNFDFTKILTNFKISGFVLSNISHLNLVSKYSDYDLIGNYSLNIFNIHTIKELHALGLNTITLSPELDKACLNELLKENKYTNTELIVYGKTPVMNINYCVLGKSNKCYSNCSKKCSDNLFYLRDRIGLDFQIIPDNTSSISTIYNSKITSICTDFEYNINNRIDIIDENLDQIQHIINTVISGEKLEGKQYTNGNFNKPIL